MHGLLGPLLVTLLTVLSTSLAQWYNYRQYPQFGGQSDFYPYPRPSPHQNIYPPTPPSRPSPPQYPQPPSPQYPPRPNPPSPPPYKPPPIKPKQKSAGPKKPLPVAPAHPSPMTRAPPMPGMGFGGAGAINPMIGGGFNQFGGYGAGSMGPRGNKHFCKAQCAHRVFNIEPRCGYDGETYRNECELQCETYEACDSTCPCFKGISSPPDHMRFILKPDPRVFPTMAQAQGKVPRGRRRKGKKRGKKGTPKKIPNCLCTDPTPEMVCSITGKDVRSACDAFCTHQQIRCDKPCHFCPPFSLGFGPPGQSGRAAG